MRTTGKMTSMIASLALFAAIHCVASADFLNDEVLACSQPDSFTVQLPEKRNVVLYSTQLLIRNFNNVSFYAYPGTNAINIAFHDIDIRFQGYMTENLTNSEGDIPPDVINWGNKGLIVGLGKLGKLNDDEYAVVGTRLHLSVNSDESGFNIPLGVTEEIVHSVESCLKRHICATIDKVKESELKDISSINELGPHAVLLRRPRDNFTPADNCISQIPEDPESQVFGKININELVDTAVAVIVHSIKENHQEEIKIGDIKKKFKAGNKIIRIKGNFEATGGTFKDLSTLRRTANAVLANEGQKYSAQCGFGLGTARAHFKHYKLRVGPVRVSGHISVDVSGLAVEAKVSVDYNRKPCVSTVEHVKITNVGKLNIKISGMGPLNHLMSKLLSWITSRYKDNIVQSVQKTLTDVATRELQKSFKCEKFRP